MVLDESCLLELIERAYAAAADGDWGVALSALLPPFRADAGSILVQRDVIGVDAGLPPDFLRDYTRHFHAMDERREIGAQRPGKVLTNARMGIPDAAFARGEFYRDFLRRVGCFYALGFTFLGDGEPLSISVHRPRETGEFEEHEVRAMERLAPHFVRAAEVSRKLLEARRAGSVAEAALDRLPSALVLLDERGRTRFVNRAARLILASHDGLWLDRGGLRAATPAVTARLRALIAQTGQLAGGRTASAGGVLSLPRPSAAPPLKALVVPLPVSTQLAATTRSAVLLLLRDPAVEPRPSAARLELLYELTPAEARLAARLGVGESLDEAAASLGVTRETVRSQLRSIFQKTDTRRQGELLRKLALDAALLPDPTSDDRS